MSQGSPIGPGWYPDNRCHISATQHHGSKSSTDSESAWKNASDSTKNPTSVSEDPLCPGVGTANKVGITPKGSFINRKGQRIRNQREKLHRNRSKTQYRFPMSQGSPFGPIKSWAYLSNGASAAKTVNIFGISMQNCIGIDQITDHVIFKFNGHFCGSRPFFLLPWPFSAQTVNIFGLSTENCTRIDQKPENNFREGLLVSTTPVRQFDHVIFKLWLPWKQHMSKSMENVRHCILYRVTY